MRRLTVMFLTVGLLWGFQAQARQSGGLRVTVTDATGAALQGAIVRLSTDPDTGRILEAISDLRGQAVFSTLSPHVGYRLAVLSGDLESVVSAVTVGVSSITSVAVQLAADSGDAEPGSGQREDLIQLTDSSTVSKYRAEFTRDLPLPARFYQVVLPLAPGVSDADHDGNPRVHGSPTRQFNALVDDVSNIDPLTGRFSSVTNSDSIANLIVVSSGAGVEFGRAEGGFARVAQTSGNNLFGMSLGIDYGSSDLDSSATAPNGTELEYRGGRAGLSVAGPIVKDKLWYRLAWERYDLDDPIDVTHGTELQERERTVQAHQLTWQATPRNRFAFQIQADPLVLGSFGIDALVPGGSAQRLETSTETASIRWTASVSDRLLVDSTLAVQNLDSSLGAQQPTATNDCVSGIAYFEPTRCIDERGGVSGAYPTRIDAEGDRLTLASQVSWDTGESSRVGNRVTFGLRIENDNLSQAFEQLPEMSVIDVDFNLALVRAEVGSPDLAHSRATQSNFSLYVEDQIRPTSNFVITIGGRLDRVEMNANGREPFDPRLEQAAFAAGLAEGIPTQILVRSVFTANGEVEAFVTDFSDRIGANPNVVRNSLPNILRQTLFWEHRRGADEQVVERTNVAPSISLSWDPWKSGKNKFAASARRYYGAINSVDLLLDDQPLTVPVSFLGTRDSDGRYEVNAGDMLIGLSDTVMVDRDIRVPYQDEWRVLYERELMPEMMLRAEYVNREYRNQLQSTEINNIPGDFGACNLATPSNSVPISPSPGAGFELTDPFTGEVYTDTDPSDGDGRLDDCVGAFETFGQSRVQRPNGELDRYVQNPGWNQVYLVDSSRESDYEAWVLQIVKRRHRRWALDASWVWSRSEGSSEQFQPFIGLDRNRLENRSGYDSDDNRQTIKLAGTGIGPIGFRFGAIVTWHSGLPFSILEAKTGLGVSSPELGIFSARDPWSRIEYGTAERNSERNPSQLLLDLRVAKAFQLPGRSDLTLSIDVFNALDDDTLAVYNPDVDQGYRLGGVNAARRTFGRRWQIGLRFQL